MKAIQILLDLRPVLNRSLKTDVHNCNNSQQSFIFSIAQKTQLSRKREGDSPKSCREVDLTIRIVINYSYLQSLPKSFCYQELATELQALEREGSEPRARWPKLLLGGGGNMYLRVHISWGQECFLFMAISIIARGVPGKHLMWLF